MAMQMKQRYTTMRPYGEWLANNAVTLNQVVQSVPEHERAIPPLHLTETADNLMTDAGHATSMEAATSTGNAHAAANGAVSNGSNGASSNSARSNGTGTRHADHMNPLQLAAEGGVNALLQPLKVCLCRRSPA